MTTDLNLRFTLNHDFKDSNFAIGLVHRPFDLNKPGTLLPWAIRTVAKTFWNHCLLMIKIESQWWIVESDTPKVHLIPLSSYEDTKLIEIWPINEKTEKGLQWLNELKQKALSRVYLTKYAKADLIWFMPIYIWSKKFYGQKVDSPKNKATCYEYIAWCLGFDEWYRMTPNEFYSELIELTSNSDLSIYRMGVYQAATIKWLVNQ